jgi:hypothetical protein
MDAEMEDSGYWADTEYDLGRTRSVRDWSGEGRELMGTGHKDMELLATPNYRCLWESEPLRRWILSCPTEV